MAEKTIITGGRIITPDRVLEGKNLVVEDGKIVDIVDGAIPSDCEVIDAGGNYVSPGFVDLHIHGSGGADFMDGTVDAFLTAARMCAVHGTTTVFPTTLTCTDEVLYHCFDVYDDAKRQNTEGARFAGLHLEGPFLNPAKAGAMTPGLLCNPEPNHYMDILAHSDHIARWTAAPELPGTPEFGNVLRDRGIIAAMGHTDATFDQCEVAFNEGFTHMNHFLNATSTMTKRNGYRIAGAVEYAYYNDDVTVELIADGIHVSKNLLRLVKKLKGVDNIALITDSMRGAGMPDGPSILGADYDGTPVVIEDGVAKLLDRQHFAGSVCTGDRLIRTMCEQGGATLVESVKMAALNPARIMGIASYTGSIEKGKDADIIFFDESVDIKRTIIGGRTVYVKD